MARIGSLIIELRAQTDKFNKGMARAREKLRRVSREVGGLSKVSAIGSAALRNLAGVVGLVGFGAMAKSAIDLGSRISDLAEQLRIGSDALQTLQVASLKAGIDQSTLERAIRNVSLRTQEAIDGNKRYEESFERLNIDLETFAKLDTGTKIEEIAKAYKEAGKSQEAFTDVARILGERAGPQMLEILRRLSEEGLPEMIKAAKEAGLVFEEDVLESLDRAADQIERFKRKATIAVGNILVDFQSKEGIEILTLRLLGAASEFSRAVLRIPFLFGEKLNAVLRTANAIFWQRITNGAKAFEMLGEQLEKSRRETEAFLEVFEQSFDNTARLSKEAIATLRESLNKAKGDMGGLGNATVNTTETFDSLGTTATRSLDNIAKAALRGRDALSQLKDLLFDEVFALAFPKGVLGALGLSGEGGLLGGIGSVIGLGKGRATGGFVGANQPVPFNADREVFVPTTAGVVQRAGGGGGQTFVFEQHFGAGLNGQTRVQILNSMPEIIQMTRAAFADDVARGTRFGRAIGGA